MLAAVGIATNPTQCDLCATPTLPSVDKLSCSVVSYNRFDYPVNHMLKEATQLIILLLDIG